MSDKPNLQLGDPPPGLARRQSGARGIWLLGLLQVLTLVAAGMLLNRRALPEAGAESDKGRLDEVRATAIALEDRSLAAESVSAWKEYLRLSPGAEDRAEVLYRVGRLLMETEDFSGAVTALVECEQLATGDENLRSKVGPKIVECLRRLGRYGEVGRELSRQVEVGGSETGQGKLLATFAGESFTAADLDRLVEKTVDRLLAMQPEGQFQIGREQLLAQYQSGEARQRLLQQTIQRELFSRRARELKIDREDAFTETREFVETELLAGQFLARELAKIQATDVDLESFYAAHKNDYRQPETASVIVLPLKEDQTADDVLTGLKSADAFRKLADDANGEAELAPIRIVKGEPHFRLGDTAALFALAAGEWTKTPITAANEKLLVLIGSKTAASTPPLTQVRLRVAADYRRRKQQELTEQLGAELMSRYDVRIVAAPSEGAMQEPPTGADASEAAAREENE